MANSLRPPANTEFPPFAAIPLLFAPFKSVGPVTYKRTIKCGLVRDYTYRVLQTIQMKLILLGVMAERSVLGIAKTTLKFKNEI